MLWDVDGTLIDAGGATAECFDLAVSATLGHHPGPHDVAMSGKTDPSIALEILAFAGLDENEAEKHLPSVLERLEAELEAAVATFGVKGRILPGVETVLAHLHAEAEVVQSVLTGNTRANAGVKLRAFGLDRWLDLDVGAFGSDRASRDDLVPVAMDRARRLRGLSCSPEDVWVVRDTPATWPAPELRGPGACSWALDGSRRPNCGKPGPSTCSRTSGIPIGSAPCCCTRGGELVGDGRLVAPDLFDAETVSVSPQAVARRRHPRSPLRQREGTIRLHGYGDSVSKLPGDCGQPLVVGDEPPELPAEALCGGEVDGLERAQLDGEYRPGQVQHTIVDPNEIHARQHPAASSERPLPPGQQRPEDLGAYEGAGDERTAAPEVSSQRIGLCLPNRQLHDR